MPVVVLIHGFAEDGNVWHHQINFLQKYFTVIIPDLPGSGRSVDNNEDKKNLSTIEYYADCLFHLIKNENIDSCFLFGHSMGGYISLAFAEKYGSPLKGFGFVHSTAFADSDEKKESRKKGIDLMEKYGSYAFLKNTTSNLFAEPFKQNHKDEIDALIENGKSFSVKTLQQYYTAMMKRKDRTNIIREAKFPILFIIGKDDAALSLKDLLQQVHLPSISYIHILENVGHMSLWEDPKSVNAAIRDFVNDISVQ